MVNFIASSFHFKEVKLKFIVLCTGCCCCCWRFSLKLLAMALKPADTVDVLKYQLCVWDQKWNSVALLKIRRLILKYKKSTTLPGRLHYPGTLTKPTILVGEDAVPFGSLWTMVAVVMLEAMDHGRPRLCLNSPLVPSVTDVTWLMG